MSAVERVLLLGGSGMVGQAVLRRAPVVAPGWVIDAPPRSALDLLDPRGIAGWLASRRYDLVVVAAAKVGGIRANMQDQAGFLYENTMIGMNVLRAADAAAVPRLVYLGSSCMYPRDFGEPLREDHLLAAPFEPTNEGYALAKVSTARLAEYLSRERGRRYHTLIPCNLFGPGDRYDAERGHLLASILLKLHGAVVSGPEPVEIWGDGTQRREFLYVDDLADAILTFGGDLERCPPYLNVGSGVDHPVDAYYEAAARVVGYAGAFRHDRSKPTGMQRKLMDSSRARALGWAPRVELEEGLRRAYDWFRARAGELTSEARSEAKPSGDRGPDSLRPTPGE